MQSARRKFVAATLGISLTALLASSALAQENKAPDNKDQDNKDQDNQAQASRAQDSRAPGVTPPPVLPSVSEGAPSSSGATPSQELQAQSTPPGSTSGTLVIEPAAGAPSAPLAEPHPQAPEAAPAPGATPKATQLKLELENGTSIRFGLLWQTQYEARGNATNNDVTQNIFLRRFALLIGGTILKDFEYFIDTDFADLFKAPANDTGAKSGPAIQVKDALGTFRVLGDELKIDAGLLIPPGAHNSLQGGGSIFAWDFFLNTFRHGTVFGSTANPYGRDVGAQLRGLVGPLEYRAGVYQGRRIPAEAGPPARAASRNPFRFAGRVQLNFLDPETGYFYSGTYLGTKRVFSIGASADFQHREDHTYRTFAGDAFLDLPVAGNIVTAQINAVHRDGDGLVDLPKQTALLGEAGYTISAIKLTPIVRYERRWGRGSAGNETDFAGGLAFWAFGHNANIKAFVTRLVPEKRAHAYTQFNLQWQLYTF